MPSPEPPTPGPCGCRVLRDRRGSRVWPIIFCPLHEAAPSLLAALKPFIAHGDDGGRGWCSVPRCAAGRAAIARAEGREVRP